MGEDKIEDDRGIFMEDVCVVRIRNLDGRLTLIFARAGILVCVVVVVVVGVLFFRKYSLLVTEMECLGIGFGLLRGGILKLGGNFVAMVVKVEVKDLELVIKAVVRLVWGYLGRRIYFMWRLNLMLMENFQRQRASLRYSYACRFLRLLFILDSGCPGMVTGANVEMEMVVRMVAGGGCKSCLT